jgi:hypothetical protein
MWGAPSGDRTAPPFATQVGLSPECAPAFDFATGQREEIPTAAIAVDAARLSFRGWAQPKLQTTRTPLAATVLMAIGGCEMHPKES